MLTRDTVIAASIPLFQKYRVKRAALFGSVVRNEAGTESDVDVLVEMSDRTRPYDFFNLQADLSDYLGHHVDLVEFTALHPRLKDRILADAVTVYQVPS